MCTKTDWNILATQSQLSDFICRDIFKFMATGFLSNDHLLNFSVNQSHYWCSLRCKKQLSPAGNYMFKVNNRNTRTRYEICSKLTIKIPERRHWRRSIVFIVNFKHSTLSSVCTVNFEQVNAGWVRSVLFWNLPKVIGREVTILFPVI